jgi:hypothetical protein
MGNPILIDRGDGHDIVVWCEHSASGNPRVVIGLRRGSCSVTKIGFDPELIREIKEALDDIAAEARTAKAEQPRPAPRTEPRGDWYDRAQPRVRRS